MLNHAIFHWGPGSDTKGTQKLQEMGRNMFRGNPRNMTNLSRYWRRLAYLFTLQKIDNRTLSYIGVSEKPNRYVLSIRKQLAILPASETCKKK